jgi:hypothetical protein
MPYDPPILIYDQNHKNLKFYAENRLKPYNAEYTRRTGNLPPQECRDLSNVEAILSYVRSAGFAQTMEEFMRCEDD